MIRHFVDVTPSLYSKMRTMGTGPKVLRSLVETYRPKRLVGDPTYDYRCAQKIHFGVTDEYDKQVRHLMEEYGVKYVAMFYRSLVFTYFFEQEQSA